MRPLGVGEILDHAVRLYKSTGLTLMKAVAVVVVPVQLLGGLVQMSALPEGIQRGVVPGSIDIPADPTTPLELGQLFTFLAAILVTGLLTIVASQLATAATLKAVSDTYLGWTADWRTSLRFAAERLPSLLWIALLTTVLATLGLIACILPGVWLWTSWAVAVPVLLVEGERGWGAMSRSMSLVRRRFWPTLAALVLAQVLVAIVSNIAGGLFSLLLPLASDNAGFAFFASALGGAIGQTLTIPFVAAVVALIYFDLRVRAEGLDLELLAQRLGTPVAGPRDAPQAPPPPVEPGPPWESR